MILLFILIKLKNILKYFNFMLGLWLEGRNEHYRMSLLPTKAKNQKGGVFEM
jgi:hypothetical protein